MSELWIKSGNREVHATRDRTELVQYLGEKAIFDHMDINGIPSFKVFKHHPDYDVALQYCKENQYPCSTNQVHVSETINWFFERSIKNEDIDEVFVREDKAV